MTYSFLPIGFMKTCFGEKFGTPRQAGLVPGAHGVLKLNSDPAFSLALQQLETFSHVWLIYAFDRHAEQAWRPLIESPRVDAPRVGVFASRSPHRPNPIGMSALKLERIDFEAKGGIELHLSGVDILDGTPVFDIKPYLPYADLIPSATSGWAGAEIEKFPVSFSEESEATLSDNKRLRTLIEQMLSLDPRPISQRKAMPLASPDNEGRVFRFRVTDFDVEWQVKDRGVKVLQLHPLA